MHRRKIMIQMIYLADGLQKTFAKATCQVRYAFPHTLFMFLEIPVSSR
jgi:hypothetical protein